jgi:integrase
MRKPALRIAPYRHSATASFVIEGLRIEGKRVRKFFKTKGEAKAELDRLQTQISNEGLSALTIPDDLRIMAVKCAEQLQPFGKTIAEATRFYVDYLRRTERSCTLAELVTSFVDAKTKDGASARYIKDLRLRLARAAESFGERKVATIEAREMDDWLRALPLGPQSRNNYRTVLHALFTYAVDRDYCLVNPVARTAKAKLVDKPPAIFTPEQAASLLTYATPFIIHTNESYVLPALAIGLFAGLRQAEIARLDWKEIDLARGFIEITANKAKTSRRRLVTIEPNLAAWLAPYTKRSGNVLPPNARNKIEAIWKRAGLKEWPDNGLRHSFASYHLAHFKDANRLALELGHGTTQMLFAHYRELVRPDEASRYWKIRPEQASKILPFAAHA